MHVEFILFQTDNVYDSNDRYEQANGLRTIRKSIVL